MDIRGRKTFRLNGGLLGSLWPSFLCWLMRVAMARTREAWMEAWRKQAFWIMLYVLCIGLCVMSAVLWFWSGVSWAIPGILITRLFLFFSFFTRCCPLMYVCILYFNPLQFFSQGSLICKVWWFCLLLTAEANRGGLESPRSSGYSTTPFRFVYDDDYLWSGSESENRSQRGWARHFLSSFQHPPSWCCQGAKMIQYKSGGRGALSAHCNHWTNSSRY